MKQEDIVYKNHDLLGPLFYRYFYKLHLILSGFDPEKSIVLFLSRGGIRLRHFYELFLEANSLKCPVLYSDFYVSRMAIIKSSLVMNYENVYQDFIKEFAWYSVGNTVNAFFGKDAYNIWAGKNGSENREKLFNQEEANRLIWGDTPAAEYLRFLLHDQYNLYNQYLENTVKCKKAIYLVDTGWSGSILNYMDTLDGNREYLALFFGRYNYGEPDPPWFNKVMGVEIQGVWHDRIRPETALFVNRHLIEGLCEIRWKSVEGYRKDEKDGILPIGGKAETDRIAPIEQELQAIGVARYIKRAESGLDIEKIQNTARKASKRIERRMVYPTKKDTIVFSVETRSADFGKKQNVAVLCPKCKRYMDFRGKFENITKSLWPHGQISREFFLLRIPLQLIYSKPGMELKLRKIGSYLEHLYPN